MAGPMARLPKVAKLALLAVALLAVQLRPLASTTGDSPEGRVEGFILRQLIWNLFLKHLEVDKMSYSCLGLRFVCSIILVYIFGHLFF